MKKLCAIVFVSGMISGCVSYDAPSSPMPKNGTYEYWGKVNGRDVYILWAGGKEYTEKQANKKRFVWNACNTTTNNTVTIKKMR